MERFTDSDKLINEDGTLSTKTIRNFVEETKNKNLTEEITDITKVIPVEYLRFQEDRYTFGYNGKEYGFFVSHRIYRAYKYIDVVIVDFTYDLVDAVSSIQAKHNLLPSFSRYVSAIRWRKF